MLLLSYLSVLLTRSFGHAWPNTGRLKVKFRNPAPAEMAVTVQGQVERLEDGHGVQYALCAVRLDRAGGDSLITRRGPVGIELSAVSSQPSAIGHRLAPEGSEESSRSEKKLIADG